MTIRDSIKMLVNDPWNAYYFWQGNIRQWLYENYPALIRLHIQEQYEYRRAYSICSKLPSCKVCGCSVSGGLFFADKACALSKIKQVNWYVFEANAVCYSKMLDRRDWELYKKHHKL